MLNLPTNAGTFMRRVFLPIILVVIVTHVIYTILAITGNIWIFGLLFVIAGICTGEYICRLANCTNHIPISLTEQNTNRMNLLRLYKEPRYMAQRSYMMRMSGDIETYLCIVIMGIAMLGLTFLIACFAGGMLTLTAVIFMSMSMSAGGTIPISYRLWS